MKYAWIENDVIRDVVEGTPSDYFHSDIAKFYNTVVPDEAANGDSWFNDRLIKKEVVEPVTTEPQVGIAIPPVVTVIEWKMLFTVQERIAAKTSTDPIIQDLQELMNDPRTTVVDLGLGSIQDALDYMTVLGIIAAGRKEEILTGKVR